VREGRYHADGLNSADEIFLTGTGSGINYVRQFERKRFPGGGSKLLAPHLRRLYIDATHGRLSKHLDWILPLK